MTKVTLAIQGMSCNHCVTKLQETLAATPGVVKATVILHPGQAKVEYDEANATPALLAAAVATAGYSATVSS
jgi:copper chaperone CopZ